MVYFPLETGFIRSPDKRMRDLIVYQNKPRRRMVKSAVVSRSRTIHIYRMTSVVKVHRRMFCVDFRHCNIALNAEKELLRPLNESTVPRIRHVEEMGALNYVGM